MGWALIVSRAFDFCLGRMATRRFECTVIAVVVGACFSAYCVFFFMRVLGVFTSAGCREGIKIRKFLRKNRDFQSHLSCD